MASLMACLTRWTSEWQPGRWLTEVSHWVSLAQGFQDWRLWEMEELIPSKQRPTIAHSTAWPKIREVPSEMTRVLPKHLNALNSYLSNIAAAMYWVPMQWGQSWHPLHWVIGNWKHVHCLVQPDLLQYDIGASKNHCAIQKPHIQLHKA